MKKIVILVLFVILLCFFISCGRNVNVFGNQSEEKSIQNTQDFQDKQDIEEEEFSIFDNESLFEMLYKKYGAEPEQVETHLQKLKSTVNLSVVYVTTKDNAEIISRDDYVDCIVEVFNCDEQYVISSAEAGIRVRGNATAYQGNVEDIRNNQVPYRIKFNKKLNMLGLNDGAKFKNWVLLKAESSLIADYLAFKLGKTILRENIYCSDCTFVQVYVNQEYKGLYLLAEQNQIGKNRIEINEVEEDYSGTDIGYLLEIDNYASENYFTMRYSNAEFTDIFGVERMFAFKHYSLKNDVYSQDQVDFIAKYTNNCFVIVLEATKGNYLTFDENYDLVAAVYDNAYDTINAVMDIDSVVNMYILDEIVCDRDCGTGSFYMCVDFSGESDFNRLTFVSPWDSGWGYTVSCTDFFAGAFQDEAFVEIYGDRSNAWYVVFATQDWFDELVRERWKEVYTEDGIIKVIENTYKYIEENEAEFNRQFSDASNNGLLLLDWVSVRLECLDAILNFLDIFI